MLRYQSSISRRSGMCKLMFLFVLCVIAILWADQRATCQDIPSQAFFNVPGLGTRVSVDITPPCLDPTGAGFDMSFTYTTPSAQPLGFIVSPMVFYAKGNPVNPNKFRLFYQQPGPSKTWSSSVSTVTGLQMPNYHMGLTRISELSNSLVQGRPDLHRSFNVPGLPISPTGSDYFVVLNILRDLPLSTSPPPPSPSTNQLTYLDGDSATSPAYSTNLALGRGRILTFTGSSSKTYKGASSTGSILTDTVYLPLGNSFTMAHQDTYHLVLQPTIYGASSGTSIQFGAGDTQHTVVVAPPGLPICATTGTQQSISVAQIPGGGAYVAWEDWRLGDSLVGIYAQRLDKNGVPQWAANGVRVSPMLFGSNAYTPHIASDQTGAVGAFGGVYVVWQDFRNGNADIFIQNLDSSGTPKWSAGGVKVCDAPNVQDDAFPVSLLDSSVVVVWNDDRTGSLLQVYAQRFNSAGTAQWTANGIHLTSAYAAYETRAASDGGTGAYAIWTEYNPDSSRYFVVGQHLASDGTQLWGSEVSLTTSVPGNQNLSQVIYAGGGKAIVTWQDARSGVSDIYAQKLNSNGTRAWNAAGAPVCTAADIQQLQVPASDGSGGAIISWIDRRNANSWTSVNSGLTPLGQQVRGFAVNGANLFAGTAAGVFRSTTNGNIWTAASSGLTDTSVRALAVKGTDLFAGTSSGGVFRSTDDGGTWAAADVGLPGDQVQAFAVNGTNLFAGTFGGGTFISSDNGGTWFARDLVGKDIHAFSVIGTNLFAGTDGDGVYLSTNDGGSWSTLNSGLANHLVMALAASGTDLFAGTYGGGVYRLTNTGASWAPATGGLPDTILSLAVNGTNLYAGTASSGVYVSANKGASWTAINAGLTWPYVSTLSTSGIHLYAGGSGGVFSFLDNGNGYDLYAQRMTDSGFAAWTNNGIAVGTGFSNQTFPSIAPSPRGGAVIAWQDGRLGFDRDIYAQYLDLAGNAKWAPNGLAVCTAPDSQLNTATVIVDPDTGNPKVVVCWEDKRNPATGKDILSSMIQADGTVQENTPGAIQKNFGLNGGSIPFYQGRPIPLTANITTQLLWAITEIPATVALTPGQRITIYAVIYADSSIVYNDHILYKKNDTVATNFWMFQYDPAGPTLQRDSVRQDGDSIRFFSSALALSGIAFPLLEYERPDHSTGSLFLLNDYTAPEGADLYNYKAALPADSVVTYRYKFIDEYSRPSPIMPFKKPAIPLYDSSYRTITPDQISNAQDLSHKFGKPVKKKNEKVRFVLNTTTPALVSGLKIKFDIAAVCTLYTGTNLDALLFAQDGGPSKSLILTFPSPIEQGQRIQIRGMGVKGKPIKAKVTWTTSPSVPSQTLGVNLGDADMNQPLLPMPNVVNILQDTYGPNLFVLDVGIPPGTSTAGWIAHKKYTDVVKSLKAQHAGSPNCFSWLHLKKKPSDPITLQNNILFADATCLKLSIEASTLGITPYGFGNLIYFDHGHPLDGMTLDQISRQLDTVLSNCAPKQGLSYQGYDTVLYKILKDFSEPLDTVSWGAREGLVATGVKKLNQVSYLIPNPSALPFTRTRARYSLPEVFALQQNYPNPFNPVTTIEFSLPTTSTTTLKVYNILGQVVATLLDRELLDDGDHEVQFAAHNLASGVYFYRLVADEIVDPPDEDEPASTGKSFVSVKKMLIIK